MIRFHGDRLHRHDSLSGLSHRLISTSNPDKFRRRTRKFIPIIEDPYFSRFFGASRETDAPRLRAISGWNSAAPLAVGLAFGAELAQFFVHLKFACGILSGGHDQNMVWIPTGTLSDYAGESFDLEWGGSLVRGLQVFVPLFLISCMWAAATAWFLQTAKVSNISRKSGPLRPRPFCFRNWNGAFPWIRTVSNAPRFKSGGRGGPERPPTGSRYMTDSPIAGLEYRRPPTPESE